MAQVSRTVVLDRPAFTAWRSSRFFVVQLKTAHRIFSTSPKMGGQADGIHYLVNHQSQEAKGHMDRHDLIAKTPEEQYHDLICKEIGLDPVHVAMMGTAANMNYLGRRSAEFKEFTVDAFVTAGVEGNAARSGDPAVWYETEKGMQYMPPGSNPQKGTINTILVMNQVLTPAAQARAVVTMTEAKTAALLELAIGSRYSSHLATGTGTDQYIIAAPVREGVKGLRWAGSHSKLGELIGQAVRGATLEALRWQNGLESSLTRSVFHALGRFGLNEKTLLERMAKHLTPKGLELVKNNTMAVFLEPRVSAAAFAYAAVLDRLQYGTLSAEIGAEALRDQGASVAVAIAGKPERWPEFWNRVAPDPADRLAAFAQGLALGWEVRWAWRRSPHVVA